MASPQWGKENLQNHYDKRLRADDHCWRELLKITRPMTKDEYEQESYRAFQSGSLEYEAWSERHGQSLYRVDKRTVLAIATPNRKVMRTCYHKHFHGRHIAGSTTPKLEHLIEYLDDLDASLDGKTTKLSRIESVNENLSKNQVKKYITPKLKSLRDKCAKGE